MLHHGEVSRFKSVGNLCIVTKLMVKAVRLRCMKSCDRQKGGIIVVSDPASRKDENLNTSLTRCCSSKGYRNVYQVCFVHHSFESCNNAKTHSSLWLTVVELPHSKQELEILKKIIKIKIP